jgi:NADH-quinone oxidoreductase subunit M
VTQLPLLSILTWLPALGALFMLVVRERATQRLIALGSSLVALVVAIVVLVNFNQALFSSASASGPRFAEQIAWVPSWGLSYHLAADGINIWLVVLTTFMMPFAIWAARTEQRSDANYALLLLLETGILGSFLAHDLILFYVFFEFTLVPTALLLGMWGGEQRIQAATKFFLYTFAGSVFMLLSIIALYILHGQAIGSFTFDYRTIISSLSSGALAIEAGTARWLFGGFFIAFAIKIALWPFHTWMPLLHGQTPGDGSVDIAAVLLKTLGGYGLIRFALALFPLAAQWATPAIAVLAIIGVLYGAWVAYSQRDAKQLLAYSSVSHLSFVVLGIFALNSQGISGALIQLVNYGLTTGALFLAVAMLEAHVGTRQTREMGGLLLVMPTFGGLLLAIILASIGLPGLNGFIGEFAIMQGTWLSPILGWRYVLVAVLGVIFAAVYLLGMFRHAFMGPLRSQYTTVGDLSRNQLLPLGVLFLAMLAIGLYPNIVFAPMQPAVEQLVVSLGGLAAIP